MSKKIIVGRTESRIIEDIKSLKFEGYIDHSPP